MMASRNMCTKSTKPVSVTHATDLFEETETNPATWKRFWASAYLPRKARSETKIRCNFIAELCVPMPAGGKSLNKLRRQEAADRIAGFQIQAAIAIEQ